MDYRGIGMMGPSKPITPARIMELANAFYGSSTLFAASDAGVFAFLAENPESDLPAVADACGFNLRAARLVLDSCVALGLLCKSTSGRYCNSAESGAFLVPGNPGSLHDAIRYNRDVYSAWGKLPEFLSSGKPVEPPSLHLGDDAERTRAFVLAMHERAMSIGRALVPHIDLNGCTKVLDLGGGSGAYAMLTAKSNPNVSVTMMDLPAVAAIAAELIEEAGMSDRVSVIPGSYHDTPYPGEQDAVHFLGVLHQESETGIPELFKRAFDALKPGGRIHVMDMMTDATRTNPPFSALFALNMALTTDNGWVFSDEDLAGWLSKAGFESINVRPLPPPMPHWLATARRPA